jgi:hypothetical protein
VNFTLLFTFSNGITQTVFSRHILTSSSVKAV